MNEYQVFPISNFRTGFNESVEPWLLPRDAFPILKNAHLYRGVIEKIAGYDLYATMSYRLEVAMTGTIDGMNKTFTVTLANQPSTTNFYAQAAINSGATSIESFTYEDDASATLINLQSSAGAPGAGTVNLTNLHVSITFKNAPVVVGGGTYNSVIFSYDYLANPGVGNTDIMGIKPYYNANGGQDILIFNTRRVGKIISNFGIIAATQGSSNGVSEIPHEIQVANATHSPAFDGMATTFTGTIAGAPLVPGSVYIVLFTNAPAAITTITDNSFGLLTGVGTPTATGFINYATGDWTLTFSAAPAASDTLNTSICVYGNVFSGDYTNFFSVDNYFYFAFITNNVDPIRYYDGLCLNYLDTNLTSKPNAVTPYDITRCLHVVIYQNRLLLLLPTVSGALGGTQQNNIYWSKLYNPLDFSNGEFNLAPTSEAIKAFGIINTDLIVRFSNSESIFRYTGDANLPFRWDRTNSVFRCDAPYSAINYDRYLTSVGKPAIVGSDGVNVKRADEIIPDFTLNDRALLEGPVISIQSNSIAQCYGERFDDFKEGWLCFRANAPDDGTVVQRSDNILAFNYLDETYAVYTFPFNCLGFGKVTNLDTWGNDFDKWGAADYAWGTIYESLDAIVDLGGDRYGNVYNIGKSNTYVDVNNTEQPVLFDVISKNFNPFIEEGQLCRFGYIDLLVSANATTKLRVQFYVNDQIYEDSSGAPQGFYQETILTFIPTDAMSPGTLQNKVWKRIYVGAVGKIHTIRFYQNAADFTDTTQNQPVRIHSMDLWMKPAGRIFN